MTTVAETSMAVAAEKKTTAASKKKLTKTGKKKKPSKRLGRNADVSAWKKVRRVNSCAAYHHYLRTFPRGRYKTSAFKALRACRGPGPRWRSSSRRYFNYYPAYIDPIWPWILIPEPPVVIIPPEEIIPPEIIDPEPVHPIAPEPDYDDAVTLPSPEPMPDMGGDGFGDGMGSDFGGDFGGDMGGDLGGDF